MKHKAILLALALPFWFSANVHATLYEYTDDKGVPIVTDNLAKVPDKYKDQLRNIPGKEIPPPDEGYLARKKASDEQSKKIAEEIAKAPPVQRVKTQPATAAKSQNAEPKKVEVYSKAWCPYCKQALSLLDSRGVKYSNYDVEQDQQAYNRFLSLGGSGVPVVVIGSKVIHGYSEQQISDALNA